MRLWVLLLILAMGAPAAAQVPPGDPFDAGRHPNPVFTWVELKAFEAADFASVEKSSGAELLGLSTEDASRSGISMADAGVKKVKVLGRTIEVTFYPVVRRDYMLKDGTSFLLYSSRSPKHSVPVEILNQNAVHKPKKAAEARFGAAKAPEPIEIRGRPALLFEDSGTWIVFWQEGRTLHTATAKMDRRRFFRVIESLL